MASILPFMLLSSSILPKSLWTFQRAPTIVAHSAWAAEYTDCISADGLGSINECPGYDTKQSHSEAPVML